MIKLGLLSLFNEQQIWHKVQPILRDPEHALYGEFQHLPSELCVVTILYGFYQGICL